MQHSLHGNALWEIILFLVDNATVISPQKHNNAWAAQ